MDCGAGIGRITKHLLTKVPASWYRPYILVQHFEKVDLVEQDKHFLEKATEYLKVEGEVRRAVVSICWILF